MPEKEIILFCPLDWGLGHATRDVPLIRKYLQKGYKIIIAGSGFSLQFLKQEFTDIENIQLKGFKISYVQKPFFLIWILLQLPFFGFSVIREHFRLKKIIRDYGITKVISDNRYGLWNKKVKSILITHQVFIQLPKSIKFLSSILHFFTKKIISKFDECWVPDYEDFDKSLSGKLSHGKNLPINTKYIGPLSRFQDYQISKEVAVDKVPDILVIISGPEPHRTLFEKQVENRFKNSDKTVLMICGRPSAEIQTGQTSNRYTKKVSHLKTNELFFYLKNCKYIIARSGYSTIMDLHVLNLKAELSPTPGQTEQEYLLTWYTKTIK